MIAMELNGAHLGHLVKIKYPGSRKKELIYTGKITKLTHWRNGDVSITQAYDPPRYPFNAEVEIIN